MSVEIVVYLPEESKNDECYDGEFLKPLGCVFGVGVSSSENHGLSSEKIPDLYDDEGEKQEGYEREHDVYLDMFFVIYNYLFFLLFFERANRIGHKSENPDENEREEDNINKSLARLQDVEYPKVDEIGEKSLENKIRRRKEHGKDENQRSGHEYSLQDMDILFVVTQSYSVAREVPDPDTGTYKGAEGHLDKSSQIASHPNVLETFLDEKGEEKKSGKINSNRIV